MLLDYDHLVSHTKSVHKMNWKVYREQYIESSEASKRNWKEFSGQRDVDQKRVKVKKAKLKSKDAKELRNVAFTKCVPTKVALEMPRGHVCKEPDCGRTFEEKCNLERHLRLVHRGEKPYVCQEQGCGKAFGTKSNLKRHLTVHSLKSLENSFQNGAALSGKIWGKSRIVKPSACRACEGCRRRVGCEVIARWKKMKESDFSLAGKCHEEGEDVPVVEGEGVGADDFSEAAFERGNDKRSQSGTLEPEESLDPFVNMFYVCTVADCSDCKELELL